MPDQPAPVRISVELHEAISGQLDALAKQGRPVRAYHVEDRGNGLMILVCAHREYNKHDSDLEAHSAYTAIVFTTRWIADVPVRMLDRYPTNTWPF